MAHSLEVVFHGATLLVVEHSKQPYVPMKPVVSGMGLDWAAQFTKLKANTARWGIAEIAIPTASGQQGMSCLPLRKLPGWLATISSNKVRPELREKVIAYQNEADDVLWAAWQDQQPKAAKRMVELPPGHIVVDARKLAAIWNDMGKLRSRIDGLGMLESDLPPSWWVQQAITAA